MDRESCPVQHLGWSKGRLVGPGLAFRMWISLPWQESPQNARVTKAKGCTHWAPLPNPLPFSTRRRVVTLIPVKLAEGPWPSLPASMEASSAQCGGAGAGVVAVSICSHTHAGRSEPRAYLASFMRASHPNSTLMVTTNIPEAACVLALRDRAREQGGPLALHGERGFQPHGLPDSTGYCMAADFKEKKNPMLSLLGHHTEIQSPR